MMNLSLFLCHAHLYASAVSLVRGFCLGQLSYFVAVLCSFVLFPELSGRTSGFTVAGCRTPWKRFIHHRIATQITMIRLMPFCHFVKEKRPFPVESVNFWILYQYFPHQAPPPYSLFLLLLQEYHCPSLRDTIHPPCRGGAPMPLQPFSHSARRGDPTRSFRTQKEGARPSPI